MSNIFDEAIADAKKLKEIAEQNAKNRIIEAVTPKIKRLIEAEIAGEDMDLEDAEEDSDDYEEFTAGDTAMDVDSSSGLDLSYNEPVEPEMPADMGSPMMTDDIDLDDGLGLEIEDDKPEKNVVINVTVESARKSALSKLRKRKAVKLLESLRSAKNASKKRKMLSELAKLQRECISSSSTVDKKLARKLSTLLKETNMSRRTRKNWFLFEGEGEGEDEDLDLGGDEDLDLEDEDEEVDVDAIKSAIEELADAVGLEVMDEDEDEDEDVEGEEEEEEEDLDLGEADMDDVDMAEGIYEADMDEDEDLKEDDDKVVEINESALRRDLMRMKRNARNRRSRRLAESRRSRSASRRRRRLFEAEAVDAASHFGGGSAEQEMFIDVDENTLINALAEELGDAHDLDMNIDGSGDASKAAGHFGGGKAQAIREARRRRAIARRAKITESRAKRAVLAERKKAAAAKRELKESNLFNAKLLYVNKLMQQHVLNKKQQRAIVEALDNAKTLREAKLLFEGLSDSLSKAKRKSGNSLNESRVISGRSSTATRSSAPATTQMSSDLSRWQKLAGIKK